jgi:hypothetical protein
MAPVSPPRIGRSGPPRCAGPADRDRRAALFASWLQRSDAPDAAMAAQAITATVRRFGIHGCISRMAQEFGEHPDAAAERMRWVCQLAAELPAWPPKPTAAGCASSTAGKQMQTTNGHNGAAGGLGARPGCRRAA